MTAFEEWDQALRDKWNDFAEGYKTNPLPGNLAVFEAGYRSGRAAAQGETEALRADNLVLEAKLKTLRACNVGQAEELSTLRAGMWKLAEELRAECNIVCAACSENWDLGLHGCHYEPIPADWPKEDDFDSQSQPCKARSKRKVIKRLESLAGSNLWPGGNLEPENCKTR